MDARRKLLWNGIGRAARPPTPPGYGIPTHLHVPKLLMNAKFLAEVYLSRIQEHENLVTRTVGTNSQGLDRPDYQIYIAQFSHTERQLKQNTNSCTQAPRPKLSTDYSPRRVAPPGGVVFGIGEEVALEEHGQKAEVVPRQLHRPAP